MSDFATLDPAGMSARDRYLALIGLLVPRPIAWVTSQSRAGLVNAAPFSFYAGISASPPILGVGVGRHRDGSRKDTAENILATEEFVVHLTESHCLEQVVATAAEYPRDVSEPDALGLELTPSLRVAVPALASAHVRMECQLYQHHEIGDGPVDWILGRVLAFRLRADLLDGQGRPREDLLRPVGRLGRQDYAPVTERLTLPRPPAPEERRG